MSGGGHRIHDFFEQPAAAIANFTCKHFLCGFETPIAADESYASRMLTLKRASTLGI
jgi:hypothetical protein